VDKESVGGCGGIIGRKKGAVAIRITYKGIRLLFISCHLSGNYILYDLINSHLFKHQWNII